MPFAETSLENTDTAPSESWLAHLIAFFARLFAAITQLKRHTPRTQFKDNWRDHYEGLRQSEWTMTQMLVQGAALLLSGRTLDDADYIEHPMPADFGGPCPKRPHAISRRFLILAQFMRDPSFYIHRHAARIAKRRNSPLRLAAHATSPGLRPVEANTSNAHDLLPPSRKARGRWIAASSRRDGGGSHRQALNALPRAPPTNSLFPTPHSHPQKPRFWGRWRMRTRFRSAPNPGNAQVSPLTTQLTGVLSNQITGVA